MTRALSAAIRLQKIIAQAGLASRRKAEEMIRQGRVRVNGSTVTILGTMVDAAHDVIAVDGRRLRARAPMRYLVLHKPAGCVTTAADEKGRPTVFDLLKHQSVRLFPVGRLDFNTEGLLLLTNDGPLANRLLHPRYGMPRVYLVRVNGTVAERDLEAIRRGVDLPDGRTLPAQVQVVRRSEKTCWLRMTLREGKTRQVHRMLECCGGYGIRKLQRIGMGPLTLAGLAPGQFRSLEPFEVDRLYQVCGLSKTVT
jgi:23S rRNA pseudouridine2605 synthase